MAGPRKKFRERPKKTGAKKRQRVKAQRRRLIAAGMSQEDVKRLKTAEEVRAAHKDIAKIKAKKDKTRPKAAPRRKKKTEK